MTADDILGALHAAGVKRAEKDASMARQTSWRIGGPADYLCVVEDEPQLEAAIAVARQHALPWLVLGGGNNVLVADAGIEGLVIVNRLRGIAIEEGPQVACGAGVFFARAAQFTARHGFSGMEWGIAIPGTVGGGIVNNAGAHGSDISRSLISADLIDETGRRERLTTDDLSYRYRQSVLKTPHAARSRLVVTSCRFRLQTDSAVAATARVEELRRHRLRTQPVKEASAGSTFKNPEGGHAGALIDSAGLKGRRMGGAHISPLHANFILNDGNAAAADVLGLIRLAQREVREQFGVRLEPEVQFVGRWPEEQLRPVLEPA
jgi:UDP-N-acetylmuramate dehydrogenase